MCACFCKDIISGAPTPDNLRQALLMPLLMAAENPPVALMRLCTHEIASANRDGCAPQARRGTSVHLAGRSRHRGSSSENSRPEE